ncbi:STAS domain-containing protein [Thiorhodovibrio frisius]|uniref:Putative NTP binding protein (Contains STAS domain) n=1 Tax=Thiorhodovibrio frisius TaxID=631362 RepID=H8YZS2_9GAMM|nr:STAS domain-containing protein [Thiorhodovibrio frisius]EIC22199.1 putative NTP binding protein (contains STAS domain) [Thiorhodovibrio frisius]WPL24493.1 anti-anti-sigma factor [Thiorhodovibrio frisius]
MTTDQPTPSADTLVYEGEMTIYSAAANFQRLKEVLDQRSPIHLDLSQVTEIDSAGLQLLLFAQSEADAHGLAFSIASVSETVDDMLNMLFLKRTFGVPTPAQPEAST